MKVETKYDLCNTVFFLRNNKIENGLVCEINAYFKVDTYNRSKENITYYKIEVNQIKLDDSFDESQLFKSKQELIDSL